MCVYVCLREKREERERRERERGGERERDKERERGGERERERWWWTAIGWKLGGEEVYLSILRIVASRG